MFATSFNNWFNCWELESWMEYAILQGDVKKCKSNLSESICIGILSHLVLLNERIESNWSKLVVIYEFLRSSMKNRDIKIVKKCHKRCIFSFSILFFYYLTGNCPWNFIEWKLFYLTQKISYGQFMNENYLKRKSLIIEYFFFSRTRTQKGRPFEI